MPSIQKMLHENGKWFVLYIDPLIFSIRVAVHFMLCSWCRFKIYLNVLFRGGEVFSTAHITLY